MSRTALAAALVALVAVGSAAGATRDPLLSAFEPRGDRGSVALVSRRAGSLLLVEPTEAVFATAPGREIHIVLVDPGPAPRVTGAGELPGRSHYYLGSGLRAEWRVGVARYAGARVEDAWPGIDVLYFRRDDGEIELDFEVAEGADPRSIRLAFPDAEASVGEDGGLRLAHGHDEIRVSPPLASQRGSDVAARFVVDEPCVVHLDVQPWDSSQAGLIDPLLGYSTYLGGSSFDVSRAIARDAAGNIYVVGETSSLDFPLRNPAQPAFAGGTWDMYVAKLDPTGSTLLFATYLGGSGPERGRAIFVDAAGTAWVAGESGSTDFPTRQAVQVSNAGALDAVVSELSSDGLLVSSTYLGGSGDDLATGIAADASGRARVVGTTGSSGFPTAGAFQAAFGGGATDAFVARLGPGGSTLELSSFLGGSGADAGQGLALAADGSLALVGQTDSADFPTAGGLQPGLAGGVDAFAARLDAAGRLVFSTLLGGSGDEQGNAVAFDAAGTVTMVGVTGSTDFPTVSPSQAAFAGGTADAFVSRIEPDGSRLQFSTYLGGAGRDWAFALAPGADGKVLVAGNTSSADFPVVLPVQARLRGSGVSALGDAFLTEIEPARPAVTCSTYLGGRGDDQARGLALDVDGLALLSGRTDSDDFPLVLPLQPAYGSVTDAFVARLGCLAPPESVGGSLRMTLDGSRSEIAFAWVDVAEAAAYRLYSESRRDVPPARMTAESPGAAPGIRIPLPAEPLLYFDLRAANCCGDGPR